MRLFSVIGLSVLGLCCGTPSIAQSVVDGSDSNFEKTLVARLVDTVTKKARDPLSAQFKGLTLVENQPKKWPKVICGYVNLKNGFGGYTGFRPFYFDVNRNVGGVWQEMKKSDISYPLARLPLEWSGCDVALGVSD